MEKSTAFYNDAFSPWDTKLIDSYIEIMLECKKMTRQRVITWFVIFSRIAYQPKRYESDFIMFFKLKVIIVI